MTCRWCWLVPSRWQSKQLAGCCTHGRAAMYRRWYPTVTRLPDGRAVIASGRDSPNRLGSDGQGAPPQAEIWNPAAPNAKPYNISYPSTWNQGWMGAGYYPFMAVLPKGRVRADDAWGATRAGKGQSRRAKSGAVQASLGFRVPPPATSRQAHWATAAGWGSAPLPWSARPRASAAGPGPHPPGARSSPLLRPTLVF